MVSWFVLSGSAPDSTPSAADSSHLTVTGERKMHKVTLESYFPEQSGELKGVVDRGYDVVD